MPDFDDELQAALDAAEEALNKGPYKKAMRELLATSMADIKETIPTASYADYSRLLTIVEHASATNMAQADLKDHIVALGGTAVRIARMVPSLATVLV